MNKASITYHNETEIYKLPDKEFKIIILKKLNKMQGNTDDHTQSRKQYMSNIRYLINIHHKKETNRNPETEEYMIELKNSIQSFNNRLDHAKERIS